MDNKQDGRIKADPRVTAYKLAATLFLRKVGQDPEATMTVPHPTLAGVQMQVPLWYTVAGQMFELTLMFRSIQEAAKMKQAAANDAQPAEQQPEKSPILKPL